MLFKGNFAGRLNSRIQKLAYSDICVFIDRAEGSLDTYGQPTVTETETRVSCSFTDSPKIEEWKSFADIEEIAAEVRFSNELVSPVSGDKVKIINRFKRHSFPDTTYEIVGIRDRGIFGYVCALKVTRL